MTVEREIDLYFGSALTALSDEDQAYEKARQRRIDSEPENVSTEQSESQQEVLPC